MLNVAEKNDAAKTISELLSNGNLKFKKKLLIYILHDVAGTHLWFE